MPLLHLYYYGQKSKIQEPSCLSHRFRLFILMVAAVALLSSDNANFNIALVSMTNFTADIDQSNFSSHCLSSTHMNITSKISDGEFPWSTEQQNLVRSAFYYGYVVLQLPRGYISERFGAKWVSAVSLGLGGILNLLIPVCARWSFTALVINRALNGLALSGLLCGLMSMWAKWAPASEVSWLAGGTQIGFPVGQVAAFAFGGYLCQLDVLGGWPLVFYIYGASVFLWVILWVIYAYDSPLEDPWITTTEKKYIIASIGKRSKIKYRNPPLRGMLTSPQVWTQWFVMATDVFGYFVISITVPIFMQQILGLDILNNGLYMALAFATSILSCLVVCKGSDIVRERNVVSTRCVRGFNTIIGSGGTGLTLILLASVVGCNAVLAEGLLILSQICSGFIFAGYKVVFMEIAPVYMGTLLGISDVLGSCMGFAASLSVGYMTGNGSDQSLWNRAFIMSGGLMLFGSVVFAVFVRDKEQDWAKPRSQETSKKDISTVTPHVYEQQVEDTYM